jgi:hypothetical protein
MNYDRLPEHMRDGARLYIEHGIAPGGFMMAVLENNLAEAFGRADYVNTHCMASWVAWLYNDAPSSCWGSPERVAAWIKLFENKS